MPASDGGLRLAQRAATRLIDRAATFDLARLRAGSCLGGRARDLVGLCVLVATHSQRESAMALVELDGLARRLVVAPPDLNPDHLAAIVEDAGIEAVVCDEPERFEALGLPCVPVIAALTPFTATRAHDTHWVLLTSGTLGRPKMVAHTLDALTGAIRGAPHDGKVVWSTFYDIRRYGGLQMFLRALLGKTDLVLTDAAEPLGELLAPPGGRRRHGDLRHAVALAAGADEPRAWPLRAALHPPFRRDRRSARARRPARGVSRGDDRARLRVHGSRRRLHRRRRPGGVPRRAARHAGRCRDEVRGRHAADQIVSPRVLLSRQRRADARRCGRLRRYRRRRRAARRALRFRRPPWRHHQCGWP